MTGRGRDAGVGIDPARSDTGRTTGFFPGPDARVRHLHAGSNMSPRMQQ